MNRLTKRIEKMENWVSENSNGDTAANIHYLIHSIRQAGDMLRKEQQNFHSFKDLVFKFIGDKELGDEWNVYAEKAVEEQQNAVQKQQTEEVPLQEETDSGEEAVEAQEEG